MCENWFIDIVLYGFKMIVLQYYWAWYLNFIPCLLLVLAPFLNKLQPFHVVLRQRSFRRSDINDSRKS